MAREIVAIGVACALIAGAVARGAALERDVVIRPSLAHASRASAADGLVTPNAIFALQPQAARCALRVPGAPGLLSLDLVAVIDGARRPLAMGALERRGDRLVSAFEIELDRGLVVTAEVTLRLDVPRDALVVEIDAVDPERLGEHTVALGFDVDPGSRPIFLGGRGEIADTTETSGRFLVLEDDAAPLGITSTVAPFAVEAHRETHAPTKATSRLHLEITASALARGSTRGDRSSLAVALQRTSSPLWRSLYALAGMNTARVAGSVSGARAGARVYGLDAEGAPQMRVTVAEGGRFELEAPRSVSAWYAALDASRTSAPVPFEPGTPFDLRLDVSPGGELQVRIVDGDTAKPLTARLVVHGIEGTLDPSFGPDYRASGAGPIVDALRGQVTTPLPAGRYRVAATRGIEWSVDARTVEIAPGRTTSIELAPRHVVPTPSMVGCDLHVHARPSFDTPVSTEDRVLSLVAAGVDFAVPTEHNVVGDYGPALDELELAGELAFVHGVEVTTYSPNLGHFGVFPFPPGKVPPYRHTSVGAILRVARRGDPNRIVQIHHPRLPQNIGYFELAHLDADAGHVPPTMRTDFDAIEVYNGYEIASPSRVEAVLRDYQALLSLGYRYVATGSSDSHRIQYQWAGYPRTLVALPAGSSDEPGTLDLDRVVAELKRGHATVTTGPIVELQVRDVSALKQTAAPGDDLVTAADAVVAHVVVRAAPWIDVAEIEIVVGSKLVRHVGVLSRPTELGPEPGTREEAATRTVRFDQEIVVPLPPDPRTWLMVFVRGARQLDDVLPFMPVLPMALTNPVWVQRPGVPPLPYAGTRAMP